MSDAYKWWRDALAGQMAPIQDGNPQPGFYRRRKVKGGPWVPVAIWYDANGTACCVEGTDYTSAEPNAAWLYCASNPISEADYRHACERGTWPGDAPATTAAIGDNNPPADVDALRAKITDAVAEAEAWLQGRQIVSQADADRCEGFVVALSALAKAADEKRDAEVRPHLEAQRAANARWKPIIDRVTAQVRAIKAALGPFLKARQDEKQAAASKAVASGADPVRADTRASTSGLSGRRVSLRVKRTAVIRDYGAALAFFSDHPEVKALVQKLADKVAAIDGKVPGVEIKTEQVAA